MDCRTVREGLAGYLDGWTGAEGTSIARHLETCDGCRREYEQLSETLRMVREIKVPAPGPEFWLAQRKNILDAAALHTRAESDRGVFFCVRAWSRPLGLRALVPPLVYTIGGASIAVALILSAIFLLKVDGVELAIPRGDTLLVLDEEALGEAYISGDLSRNTSLQHELDGLSDQELSLVLDSMRGLVNGGLVPTTDGAVPIGGNEEDIEGEIRGLSPKELDQLLKVLDGVSVRS